MKTLKSEIYKLLALFFVSFLVFSCEDEEKPPTNRELLIGEWVLQTLDGQSVSDFDLFVEIEFDNDGDYKETFDIQGERTTATGEWSMNDAMDEIDVDYDSGASIQWEIDDITETELSLEYDGSDWVFEKDN